MNTNLFCIIWSGLRWAHIWKTNIFIFFMFQGIWSKFNFCFKSKLLPKLSRFYCWLHLWSKILNFSSLLTNTKQRQVFTFVWQGSWTIICFLLLKNFEIYHHNKQKICCANVFKSDPIVLNTKKNLLCLSTNHQPLNYKFVLNNKSHIFFINVILIFQQKYNEFCE